jgi:hypothetical protein
LEKNDNSRPGHRKKINWKNNNNNKKFSELERKAG